MADAAVSIAEPDEFAQRRRWRAFKNPLVETNYRLWHLEHVTPVARAIGVGSAILWALVPVGFEVVLGECPRLIFVSNWLIAVPTFIVFVLASYTPLRRWANGGLAFANVVIGLDFVWVMSNLYGPVSGTIPCGVLAVIFFPLITRLSTGAVAFVTSVLTIVPVWLMISGTQHGAIALSESWTYIAVLMFSAPVYIAAGGIIESGMRRQFVAEKTVAHQQSQLQASQRLLRRYVPEQVADAVLSNTPEAIDRHERRKLTIFFSDLVGFTDLSEELEPEDLAMVLHDYFTEMSAIARHHGGTVDDLVGDAILVFFGAPERTDDHDQALRAVRMAVEMQAAMGPLNQKWEAAGIPETLRVRMGINTGIATVGNFGSEERTKYTALGKQVNIAARIQSQCEPGNVLLSHPTWLLVRDEISCTPKGELTLKGLHKPMPAFEVQI
ncbi:MAG: adenylate/guanylate cyclase domain-containing protein [Aeromicrobium sp.]